MCPFTEEYYYVVTAGFIANGQHPLVNATCSDDPYGYQVISFVGTEKFLNLKCKLMKRVNYETILRILLFYSTLLIIATTKTTLIKAKCCGLDH